jgi:hypothetical protein
MMGTISPLRFSMPQHLNIDVLIDAVAKKARLSRVTASKAVEAVLESMSEALEGSGDDVSPDSGSVWESDNGLTFLAQEQAQTRAQQWSPLFSWQLLRAFRDAIEADLNDHRAAGRPPLVSPPLAIRRATTRRDAG